MAEKDSPKRPYVSRKKLERINEIHRLMGLGKRTYLEISEAKKGERGWSLKSIQRLVTSPEMETIRKQLRDGTEDYVVGLLKRQQEQIEFSDLPPGAQLAFRQKIIELYKPRDVKVSGELKQNLTVKENVTADQLAEIIPVILDMVMEEQVRRAGQEGSDDPDESMDSSKTNP